MSAAGKEFKSESAADSLFTTPIGHTGETFVFASGDEGNKPEYPSTSPNVLSVGGSSLHLAPNGDWQYEYAWSNGGGGVSKYEGVPSYQYSLGLTSRGTPDVAYDADPNTGFAVFDTYGSGGWAEFGGTSAGTPQWAALLAIADQGRALAGKDTLANAQAVLYAMPASDFHDIRSGYNGSPATTGYDLATGLGSPKADELIPDLVAYNGSTDFTVAALAYSSGKKSRQKLQLNRAIDISTVSARMTGRPTADVSSVDAALTSIGMIDGLAHHRDETQQRSGSSRRRCRHAARDRARIDHGYDGEGAPSVKRRVVEREFVARRRRFARGGRRRLFRVDRRSGLSPAATHCMRGSVGPAERVTDAAFTRWRPNSATLFCGTLDPS